MKKIQLNWLLSLLSLIIVACNPPITTKYFPNHIEIEKGDSAKIFWEFYDAKRVRIDGISQTFETTDSCWVAPDSTTIYHVNAFNKFDEKLTVDWLVNVREEEKSLIFDDTISSYSKDYSPSADVLLINSINAVNIVGSAVLTQEKQLNELRLKFSPLDAKGKFINGIDFEKENLNIKIQNAKIIANPRISAVYENIPDTVKTNFCICLDNSSAGVNNEEILNSIGLASREFPLNDSFYLSYFNQNFGGVEPINRNSDGSFNEIFKRIIAPSGFAAINKSVGQAINYLLAKTTGNKAIIIIANSADNASVLYDENDLAAHAKSNNIPIYVIAVGSAVPTYNLSKLANGTGGKIYFLANSDANLLTNYFNEIISSQKNYYNVDFVVEVPQNETSLELELTVSNNESKSFSDNYSFPLRAEKLFSEYQVLASYPLGITLLEETFLPSITNLAEVLVANPNLIVELIGHSGSIEGNDEVCSKIALQRAQIVRRKLIELGANPAQIRLSSEGAARPLFQTSRSDWQFKYNNRVEIRWLLPEEQPYEIISGFVLSEDVAQTEVENWEEKGYKAYYQRIMRNSRPAYRILIWGYSTEVAAETDAKKLSKEFKRTFLVK